LNRAAWGKTGARAGARRVPPGCAGDRPVPPDLPGSGCSAVPTAGFL